MNTAMSFPIYHLLEEQSPEESCFLVPYHGPDSGFGLLRLRASTCPPQGDGWWFERRHRDGCEIIKLSRHGTWPDALVSADLPGHLVAMVRDADEYGARLIEEWILNLRERSRKGTRHGG